MSRPAGWPISITLRVANSDTSADGDHVLSWTQDDMYYASEEGQWNGQIEPGQEGQLSFEGIGQITFTLSGSPPTSASIVNLSDGNSFGAGLTLTLV